MRSLAKVYDGPQSGAPQGRQPLHMQWEGRARRKSNCSGNLGRAAHRSESVGNQQCLQSKKQALAP